MGGFDFGGLFTGNNPTLNKDTNQMGALAGYNTGVGEEGTNADLNYQLGILSGDPTKVAQTLAPETQQVQQQAQQNKNTVSQFGNRGGGMNSVMASLDDATRAKLLGLAGGLRQGAAANLGDLGTKNLQMASTNTMNQANLSQTQLQNFINSILGKGTSDFANTALQGGEQAMGL
jgi:hypothetical protein